MGHRSGLVGVSLSNDAAVRTLCRSLQVLRHRGGPRNGVAVHDGFQQRSAVVSRPVGVAFDRTDLDRLTGSVGIARTGPRRGAERPPRAFEVESRYGPVALGIDGDPHYVGDRDRWSVPGGSDDTAPILRALASELKHSDLPSAVERVAGRLRGGFALVALHDGVVVGVRGPAGARPLALGTVDSGRVLASESVVFDVLGGERQRDVEPGEVVVLRGDSVRRRRPTEVSPAVGSVPELVHHARPDTVVDGAAVWAVRTDLGRELRAKVKARARAKAEAEARARPALVVPGSDAGRPFAVGYARAGNARPSELLRWNRYAEHARSPVADPGPAVVADAVRGERVTLVDSTLHDRLPAAVTALAEAGAREIDVRVGARPRIADVEGVPATALDADSVTVLDDDTVKEVARGGPDDERTVSVGRAP